MELKGLAENIIQGLNDLNNRTTNMERIAHSYDATQVGAVMKELKSAGLARVSLTDFSIDK